MSDTTPTPTPTPPTPPTPTARKVEIGVLVTIALTIIAFAFWLGGLDAKVAKLDPTKIEEALTKAGGVPTGGGLPVGGIAPYAGPVDTEMQLRALESAGWLLCDGSTLDKTSKYKALSDAIAPFWDTERTSGKFRLPDLRGRFLRGVDLGAGRDVDASMRTNGLGAVVSSVGSLQSDALSKHFHPIRNYPGADSWTLAVRSIGGNGRTVQSETGEEVGRTSLSGDSAETRPKNAAVNWIIRYR